MENRVAREVGGYRGDGPGRGYLGKSGNYTPLTPSEVHPANIPKADRPAETKSGNLRDWT